MITTKRGYGYGLAAGVLAVLLPLGAAWSETPDRAQALAGIEAAEAARRRADSVGGEWRDTAAMIARARELAEAGRYPDAIELADQAKRQGELGYDQALGEQNADFPAYVLDRSR
ncbi:hypothetical protein [Allochromatium vinosum]|uniref:SoxXA-binding protein n=2 Tax=Allochromatium vinosum TaxID=1049 RepID=D3RVS8_ALLVD|nr:hypothetical protein [Allochromatium vinosum]ABE01362.1 ORF9 [Allochromatium vinosum]ADC63091.1 SoxXA-binding protein [Allochromatium vinosum DSM 180]